MSPELIVSLTSYPARIGKVHIAIDSLLKQTLKPDRIVLYLADDQFPGREADLPTELLKCVERGLTISWCEDFKSHKKLIPALIEYPDAIIVTFDDDIYFEPTRLELLYNDYIENHDKGNYIYCHRITRFFKGETVRKFPDSAK